MKATHPQNNERFQLAVKVGKHHVTGWTLIDWSSSPLRTLHISLMHGVAEVAKDGFKVLIISPCTVVKLLRIILNIFSEYLYQYIYRILIEVKD